jgi:pyruvate dehydrogenase E2 component (dihydrolipoamide acetyltransferase)
MPPQVAILGAGRIREELRVHKGAMRITRVLPLSLTFDHRAVMGGEAARFLATVIEDLEGAS